MIAGSTTGVRLLFVLLEVPMCMAIGVRDFFAVGIPEEISTEFIFRATEQTEALAWESPDHWHWYRHLVRGVGCAFALVGYVATNLLCSCEEHVVLIVAER